MSLENTQPDAPKPREVSPWSEEAHLARLAAQELPTTIEQANADGLRDDSDVDDMKMILDPETVRENSVRVEREKADRVVDALKDVHEAIHGNVDEDDIDNMKMFVKLPKTHARINVPTYVPPVVPVELPALRPDTIDESTMSHADIMAMRKKARDEVQTVSPAPSFFAPGELKNLMGAEASETDPYAHLFNPDYEGGSVEEAAVHPNADEIAVKQLENARKVADAINWNGNIHEANRRK